MRELDDLCTLINNNPSCVVDIDWSIETDNFDYQRMHDLVVKLDDMNLVNDVTALIVAEWNLLVSQDDYRCYIKTNEGLKKLKFPNSTDYSHKPIYDSNLGIISSPFISNQSITGFFYFCKVEVYRKLKPIMEKHRIQAELLKRYPHKMECEKENETPCLTEHTSKTNHGKIGRPKAGKFDKCIKKDAPACFMEVLKDMLAGKAGVDAAKIIIACTGIWIDKPIKLSVANEFNIGYSWFSEAMNHKYPDDEINEIRNNIRNMIQKKTSGLSS